MAGVLHALATAAVREVVLGGVEWRLRRVSSADLARAQAGALALLPVDPSPKKKGRKAETPEELMRRMPPESIAQQARMSDAMACASVTHVRGQGDDWEPVALIMDRDKADPEQARLWIGDLTMSTRSGLWREAMAHSTQDGEDVEVLQSFRGTA